MGPKASSAVRQRLMDLLVWATLACFVRPGLWSGNPDWSIPLP